MDSLTKDLNQFYGNEGVRKKYEIKSRFGLLGNTFLEVCVSVRLPTKLGEISKANENYLEFDQKSLIHNSNLRSNLRVGIEFDRRFWPEFIDWLNLTTIYF